ncbi:YhbY family RNA-binding protein [Candidatus Woesearchaeota archaeon]|nr:YhbY family RNA-binding protein [Candidatus Woesearchaeota archaeon]
MDNLQETSSNKALPELSSAVLLDLRRQAHAISPLVRIGKSGLNNAILEEIRSQLKTHHLVKIKALNNFMDETEMTKKDIGRFLASETNSYLISVVGYTFVLYREF